MKWPIVTRAHAPRPQGVSGYDLTICSGVVTFEHGVATGALPGRLAKNPTRTGIVANGAPAELLEPGYELPIGWLRF